MGLSRAGLWFSGGGLTGKTGRLTGYPVAALVSPVRASESDGAEAAVDEEAVLGREGELDAPFGHELDDEELA